MHKGHLIQFSMIGRESTSFCVFTVGLDKYGLSVVVWITHVYVF